MQPSINNRNETYRKKSSLFFMFVAPNLIGHCIDTHQDVPFLFIKRKNWVFTSASLFSGKVFRHIEFRNNKEKRKSENQSFALDFTFQILFQLLSPLHCIALSFK